MHSISSSIPTPPIPEPPRKQIKTASTNKSVITLDTNAATLLLNGYILLGQHKDKLLTYNPTWVELLRNYGGSLEAYSETNTSLNMYRWSLENASDVSFRITTTVASELKSSTAVSSFSICLSRNNNMLLLMP